MESAQIALTRNVHVIKTVVKQVEEHKTRQHISGMGKDATFDEVSLGWFVLFEGSYECIFFGNERPSLAQGDKVKITFEKEPS